MGKEKGSNSQLFDLHCNFHVKYKFKKSTNEIGSQVERIFDYGQKINSVSSELFNFINI